MPPEPRRPHRVVAQPEHRAGQLERLPRERVGRRVLVQKQRRDDVLDCGVEPLVAAHEHQVVPAVERDAGREQRLRRFPPRAGMRRQEPAHLGLGWRPQPPRALSVEARSQQRQQFALVRCIRGRERERSSSHDGAERRRRCHRRNVRPRPALVRHWGRRRCSHSIHSPVASSAARSEPDWPHPQLRRRAAHRRPHLRRPPVTAMRTC